MSLSVTEILSADLIVEAMNSTGGRKQCPVCENDFSCPTRVCVITGEYQIGITGSGVEFVSLTEMPIRGLRGVVIYREYMCESVEHHWCEIEIFHKGVTYRHTQVLDGDLPWGVIWRD